MKPVRVSIGFTRGSGLVSKLIRRLDGGYFNHVYWRFDFLPTGSLIYESHIKGGVQITPYEGLLSAKMRGKVLAIEEYDLNLSPYLCQSLYNACLPEHGDHYNTMQIIRYYFWIRFCKRKDSKWINKLTDKYTCNTFVVKTGRQVVDAMSGLDYSYTIRPLRELAKRCFTPLKTPETQSSREVL